MRRARRSYPVQRHGTASGSETSSSTMVRRGWRLARRRMVVGVAARPRPGPGRPGGPFSSVSRSSCPGSGERGWSATMTRGEGELARRYTGVAEFPDTPGLEPDRARSNSASSSPQRPTAGSVSRASAHRHSRNLTLSRWAATFRAPSVVPSPAAISTHGRGGGLPSSTGRKCAKRAPRSAAVSSCSNARARAR